MNPDNDAWWYVVRHLDPCSAILAIMDWYEFSNQQAAKALNRDVEEVIRLRREVRELIDKTVEALDGNPAIRPDIAEIIAALGESYAKRRELDICEMYKIEKGEAE